jgi:ubiquinone/menaquinone biosynthesis C-methylase UbiE
MNSQAERNSDQSKLWNGVGGAAWVDAQPVLDDMLKPFEALLVEGVPSGFGGHVLDIGCGTGGTTLAIAQRLGPGGSCVGVDISEPMLALARKRAADARVPASFIRADAQVHAFEPASYDVLLSRFGVMFFDDPVEAFANLHRAAKPGAGLAFIAWRSADENPFMTTAEKTAAPLLPNLPQRKPDGPGQFAFAVPSRVRQILTDSRWRGIEVAPIDVPCQLPEPELMRFITRLGSVGMALQEADEATRARVIEAVRRAFDQYVSGAQTRFTAACWKVSAVA